MREAFSKMMLASDALSVAGNTSNLSGTKSIKGQDAGRNAKSLDFG